MHDFFRDMALPGCNIQVGTYDRIIDTFEKNTEEIPALLEMFEDQELFFLGGVNTGIGKIRAKDEDIIRKPYVYFDFDYRTLYPKCSDEEIISWIHDYLLPLLTFDETFSCWRHVNFSGNGVHLYFCNKEVAPIKDVRGWKIGLREKIEKLETILKISIDRQCVNPARLARMPGSMNMKNGALKKCVTVASQDEWAPWLTTLEADGAVKLEKMREEQKLNSTVIFKASPLLTDTYEAIRNIPIYEVVQKLHGWIYDGKHFFDPSSNKAKACFVPDKENFLVHGGTDHIPASSIGFSTFTLVKTVKELDNAATFEWFRRNYEHIQKIGDEERRVKNADLVSKGVSRGHIGIVLRELTDSKFEQLMLHNEFDEMKFIIRGAVTRIGSFSNIGKSRMAYFLSHTLLGSGYRGVLISTEVPRSIVLANLLTITTGKHFWDILEKRVPITEEMVKHLERLEIYDVNHTGNTLPSIETLLQRSIDAGEKPDFVVIDFCQGISPAERVDGMEYTQMSKYAFEVQSMAQRLNIAVIDLSQISNEGLRDEFRSVGFIPFKGSGHLYSSADIGILLRRDKKTNENIQPMHFEIRKHKYYPPFSRVLDADFTKGTFKVALEEWEKDTAPDAQLPFSP